VGLHDWHVCLLAEAGGHEVGGSEAGGISKAVTGAGVGAQGWSLRAEVGLKGDWLDKLWFRILGAELGDRSARVW